MNRVLLIVFVGLVSAYLYLYAAGADSATTAALHRQLISGEIPGVWRYRFLSPALVNLLVPATASDGAIMVAYALAHAIALPFMYLALDSWLRLWVSSAHSLAGTLLVAVLFPVMLKNWQIELYSVLEVVLLCASLVVLVRRPRFWRPAIAVLTVLSVLNRETGLLVPLCYFTLASCEWRTRRYWMFGGGLLALGAATFGGLILWRGYSPGQSIGLIWQQNIMGGWYIQTAITHNWFFLPLWWAYLRGLRAAPDPLRRLVPVAALYLALIVVFGFWNEVRLLLPLLVFTLPVALPRLARSVLPPDPA